jgi:predicted nucleotidyltransferase
MTITETHLNHIIRRAQDFGATRLILFGSALETPENVNDIDLAVTMPGWEAFAFAEALEEEMQCPIDVLPIGESNQEHPFVQHILRKGRLLL